MSNVITLHPRQFNTQVYITITNVDGTPTAHPANRQAELLAKMAGVETLTQATLNLVLDMGFEIILRHGAGDFRLDGVDRLFGNLERVWLDGLIDEELEKALEARRVAARGEQS